jgi:cobalt ABC transporter, permease protein CbiQ
MVIKHISGRVHESKPHTHTHIKGHKHGTWISIDYFAYASKLRNLNAAFKVILSLVTIFLCIGLNNSYVSLAVIIYTAYIVICLGGLSFHDYLSILTIPLTFILLSIIAIILNGSKYAIGDFHIYLGFGYIYTTFAMLKYGLALMLKIIASISALQFMILTTPSSEIITVIRKMHVPAAFADLMNMIYRYIFILLEVFAKMKNAAESRLGYRDFKTFCRTFGSVASNLLVLSLKKAGAYYDAMEARCYDGQLLFLEEEKNLSIQMVICASFFILYLLLLWFISK